MSTVNFKTTTTIAGGVGTPVTGDTANQTERDIITALGGAPGSGATYDWKPGFPAPFLNARDYAYDVQAVIDTVATAAANNPVGVNRSIWLPQHQYSPSKPLWISTPSLWLGGSGEGVNNAAAGPVIGGGYTYGPSIVLGRPTGIQNIVPQLLTGTGSAISVGTESDYKYFNLRDAKTCDLNGNAQLGFRCTVIPSSVPATASLMQSSGTFLNGVSTPECFKVQTILGGTKLRFTLTLSTSGFVTLDSSAVSITAGNQYDIEAGYDGATMYLFLNGTLVGSMAASGTLVQGPWEDVTFGAHFSRGCEYFLYYNQLPGTYDCVGLYDAPLHTANFTPTTAKLTDTTHALAIFNFDSQYGPCSRARTKNGDFWAFQRWNTIAGSPPNGVVLHGLHFSANRDQGGLYMEQGCHNFRVRQCDFDNLRDGVYMPLRSYEWRISDSWFANISGRSGLMVGVGSGLATVDGCFFLGSRFPVMFNEGGNLFAHSLIEVSDGLETVANISSRALSSSNRPTIYQDVGVSTERGTASGTYLAPIVLSGGGSPGNLGGVARFEGGTIEAGNVAQHHVLAYGIDGASFHDVNFLIQNSQTSIVQTTGASWLPIVLDNCMQTPAVSFVQWAAAAGDAVVQLDGCVAFAFTATPTFEFSRYSTVTFAQLTGNVTAQTWQHAGEGQRISVLYRQASAGGPFTVANPGNVIGWSAIDSTAGNYSLWEGRWDQGLGKFVGKMTTGLS